MAKYRRKPTVIEAVQWWPGSNAPGVSYEIEWIKTDADGERIVRESPYVVTIHGQQAYLEPGDWILPENDGFHHYLCKPDIFAATYELVEET